MRVKNTSLVYYYIVLEELARIVLLLQQYSVEINHVASCSTDQIPARMSRPAVRVTFYYRVYTGRFVYRALLQTYCKRTARSCILSPVKWITPYVRVRIVMNSRRR